MIFIIILIILIALWIIFILGPAIVSYMLVFCAPNSTNYVQNDPEMMCFEGYEEKYNNAYKKVAELSKEKISLTARDNVKLFCDFCKNKGEKAAIILHGYRSEPYVNCANIGAILWEQGYDLFFVYNRGHFPSEGRTTLGMLEQDDLIEWVNYIKQIGTYEEMVIYGVSMGAATIGYASNRLENIKALILDCGFESPYKEIEIESKKRHLPASLILPLIRLCGKIHLKKDIKYDVSKALATNKIPTIFIHGDNDKTVPFSTSEKNYDACSSKKELIIVPKSMHATNFIFANSEEENKVISFIKNAG